MVKRTTRRTGQLCRASPQRQVDRHDVYIFDPRNPHLGGGGGSVLAGYGSSANYNGLVATVQHRLSSTFSLLANYTWSKCLNVEDAQGDLAATTIENPSNPKLDYGPCGSDYRDVENIVLVLKSDFHLANGLERALINGWEFAPATHIVGGAPFTVTSGADNSRTDVGNDRPNLVPGVPVYLHLATRSAGGALAAADRGYLNPAAFAQVTAPCAVDPTTKDVTATTCPQLGTYGNIGKNSFRGLPNYGFDAQISRAFPIHERLTTTVRLECFNVLNHPDFNIPTATTTGTLGGTTGQSAALTSSTFGQISQTTNTARVFQGSLKINF